MGKSSIFWLSNLVLFSQASTRMDIAIAMIQMQGSIYYCTIVFTMNLTVCWFWSASRWVLTALCHFLHSNCITRSGYIGCINMQDQGHWYNTKHKSIFRRSCSWAYCKNCTWRQSSTVFKYYRVAVPDRNWVLFCHVFGACHLVWHAIASAKGGAHTCLTDVSDIHVFTCHVWSLPLAEGQLYSASNLVMCLKYVTE